MQYDFLVSHCFLITFLLQIVFIMSRMFYLYYYWTNKLLVILDQRYSVAEISSVSEWLVIGTSCQNSIDVFKWRIDKYMDRCGDEQ